MSSLVYYLFKLPSRITSFLILYGKAFRGFVAVVSLKTDLTFVYLHEYIDLYFSEFGHQQMALLTREINNGHFMNLFIENQYKL